MNTDPLPLFLSTAIPYVNAPPHVGHALELLIADALARHLRQRGRDVRTTGGTDDHSAKNARAARLLAEDTASLVARHGATFRRLQTALGVVLDDYVHTSSDPRHAPAVVELWRRCQASGDVYSQDYSGNYCVGCEAFLLESDLADGRCPVHADALETVSETNWFFRLSRHRDALLARLQDGRLRILPDERRNEAVKFVERGLVDFSISRARERSRDWGIPVPGDPSQIVYVWFDALANYLSSLGFPRSSAPLARYWLGPGEREHLIGKDILRFHAVYWPAILLSAGLPLPTTVRVHGYVTVQGNKIGKSLGNTVDPFSLVDAFGITAVRYFFLRHLHTTKDGDFRAERLVEAHDGELAAKLGNLLQRVTALYARRSREPAPALEVREVDGALRRAAERAFTDVSEAVDDFALHRAIAAIFELVNAANRYADLTEPWTLARIAEHADADVARRTAAERLSFVLGELAEALRVVAVLLAPFLPAASTAIVERLGLSETVLTSYEAARWCPRRAFSPRGGPALFPRLAAR